MYIEGMQRGWMFGLPEDLSDPQWNTLRKFFPLLGGGLVLHVTISSIFKRLEEKRSGTRAWFYAVTGVVFVLVLHGRGAVWNLLACSSCFLAGQLLGSSRWTLAVTWGICLYVKWASDYYRGFEATSLQYLVPSFLDHHRGLYAWQIQFNLTLLRIISFNTERYWSLKREASKDGAGNEEMVDLKDSSPLKQDNPASSEFSFVNFLGYVYYIPLYIAGPICRFPAWVDQVRRPREVLTVRQWSTMALRVVSYIVLVEFILHAYVYVSINNNRTWRRIKGESMPGWEVAFGGFLTLQFMYVKFMAIWRFFRLWSMMDGIDVPENMNRCVNMNYTFAGFWRQWHSSLNLWILRYMYIPLGGRKTQWWSVWVIFTFVGLWHDLMWRWLAWAWLNCAMFSIETTVIRLAKHQALDSVKQNHPRIWQQVVLAGGCFNMVCLIVANLAIMHGFQGSADFLRNILLTRDGAVSPGISTFFLCCAAFFYLMMHVNMAVRRIEVAHGIVKRF